jgi:two-component sensor histidine kinase
MLLEREFAVILLDVNMPGMCGHETASIIRQRKKSRHTPIIFITAFADQAQAAEGYALGAVDYILSPIVPEILRAKVKVFVDLYQMRAELFASHVLLEERVAKRTQELAATAVSLKSEVAERTQAEERMSVLVSELTHRVKNLLAVLQSIIMRTLTDSRDIEEGRKILLGRLHALAHAHELLTVACWKGAALNDIVRAELAGFSDRVSANGPVVTLSASAVQTFALVVHELATNAAKYGSLSNAAGSVDIAWGLVEVGDDHYLDFNWKEHDGPEVRPSGQKGFGLTLIGTLAGPLASAPSIDFAPGGLICNFRMPLDVVSASANVEFRLKRPKVAAS